MDALTIVARKPRVLIVSAHCPFGLSYGAQLRTLHIARILKTCSVVGMVLIPYDVIDFETQRLVDEEFHLRAVFYREKEVSRKIVARLTREFDPYSARTESMGLGEESAAILERIIGEYDMVWFQGISIPNSLGRKRRPCSVLDIDDIPSQVFRGVAMSHGNPVSRIKACRQALLWRRRERVLLDRFGIVCVCSDNDSRYLGGGERVHVIPNGFESGESEPDRSQSRVKTFRVGFIGTLRYAPNVEGLRWFIRSVWPLIKAECKEARLRLVGLDTDCGIAGEGRDIDGLGFLVDPAEEISGWSLSIVPLRVGGGTRIKIAEAFSRKCPVVSTRLGAYGYQLESGRECLLADSDEEMAGACLRLLGDKEYAEWMAGQALRRFSLEWSWDAISPRVVEAVEACMAYSHAP